MIFDVDGWLPRLHANMQQNWGVLGGSSQDLSHLEGE